MMRHHAARIDMYLSLWSVFIILLPFYVGPSGLPQPSHVVLGLLMALVLLQRGFWKNFRYWAILRALAWFVGYVAFVNMLWVAIVGDFSIVLHPIFYIYNALVFSTFLVLHSRYGNRLLDLTMRSVGLSAILQAALVVIMPTSNLREAGFFNTSNQLGYYSVISASIFFLGTTRQSVRHWQSAVVLASCFYLALVSLSRGAIGGIVLIGVIVFLNRPRALIPLAVALLAFVLVFHPDNDLLTSVTGRVASGADDSFAMRGYDRIINHPQYLFFGAGEGAYTRFESMISTHEMHSSVGTLLFSYGLVGLGFFAYLLLHVYRGLGFRGVLYTLPVALYGTGHQGLRFTMLWIFLGFVATIRKEPQPRPIIPSAADGLAKRRHVRGSTIKGLH